MNEIALKTAVERLPYPDITWAGANPFASGYCLGSESGEILILREGKLTDRICVSKHQEAVNGVAFSQNWLAVTTRSDINLVGPIHQTIKDQVVKEQVELDIGGAHDVAVAPVSGHFVFALGPDGILFAKPGIRENDPRLVSDAAGVNFYRLIATRTKQGDDLIVAAARSTGLACAVYREGINDHRLFRVHFPGLDIIDVCSLATAEKPLAAVAAASDGTLVFFDDVLSDKTPSIVRFGRIEGALHRLLGILGSLYVLTTKGLFCLYEVGTQFLSGVPLQPLISRVALEAIDMNTVVDSWLLAVGADEVFVVDTQQMLASIHNAVNRASEAEAVATPHHFETAAVA